MTVKELINQLQKFEPDTEVWLTATTRKGIPTYATLDHIVQCDYGNLATDLTDTPDNIDMRLLGGRSDDDTVIVLSSMFDFQPNFNAKKKINQIFRVLRMLNY